ncbi:toxin co-regulated pilus biosynthesis Q family protein [Cupriavidus basilensis]|uniref:toxin co-regulated pilus biosynthesis Q family protein n=1 Tax=Cupriavidus basilensis TaxID=68895 RepID=UPI0020A6CAFD|nr:toxin co-regulated pilus biosynthesis Q family protein [Cupriavidus basilensis]MCP3023774.1 toxin co-regulated pilus biosynthesis Q family protein [Cupriavidus basilensis]
MAIKQTCATLLLGLMVSSSAGAANFIVRESGPVPQGAAQRDLIAERLAQREASVPVSASAPPAQSGWQVTPADQNVRMLLTRWASAAGWSLVWSAERDIPLVGSDQFPGDFKSAVREVLRATDMSDAAVQPCFHTNAVVRVIPATALCDRAE